MMKKLWLLCAIGVLLIHKNSAQEVERNEPRFTVGLTSSISIDVKRSRSRFDESNYFLFPLSIGGVLKTKTFRGKVELFPGVVDIELKQRLPYSLYLEADARLGSYFFNNTGFNSYEDSDWMNKMNKYLVGAGYSILLENFVIEIGGVAGYVKSDRFSASSVNFGEGNVRREVRDSFQIPYTFVYGGQIYIEWHPDFPSLKIYPFVSVEIIGANNTDAERKVEVDEWVVGNTVFRESSKDSDITYNFRSTEVDLGLIFYF